MLVLNRVDVSVCACVWCAPVGKGVWGCERVRAVCVGIVRVCRCVKI
jgi:hypothetical protein